jgi:hypothetical protein
MRVRLVIVATFVFAALSWSPGRAAEDSSQPQQQQVDWDKARQLYQRQQRGQSLTADEQAYLDHAKQVRREMTARGQRPTAATRGATTTAPASRESTGLIPLTQMKPGQTYKGLDGGLYGGGRNEPPEKLMKAAQAAAAQVRPLGADGQPDARGRIVLMSLGMSNTTMEFARFKQLADRDARKSSLVTVVDAAQGGQDAARWDVPADTPRSPWNVADQRLKSAGVATKQVQVIWIKQALAGPRRLGEFPAHADALKRHVEAIVRQAKQHYPNLRLVYLSSRIYAGFATSALNPEPYAYESAFAVRGVIEDEMKGELSEPVVLWGPYLWADGVKGREGDSLVWTRDDFAGDGTHPAGSARQKVAELLLKFFMSDPTAKTWFVEAGH